MGPFLETLGGTDDVRVVLHPEVRVGITLNVARTAEEAERQARGENIATMTAAEEARIAAEALFESEEAAKEATGDEPAEAPAEAKPKKKKAAAEKPAKADDAAPAEAKPEKKKKEKKEK